VTADRRAILNRRSLHFAYLTACCNVPPGAVALVPPASPTALLGFGLDSFVEVSSAPVVI